MSLTAPFGFSQWLIYLSYESKNIAEGEQEYKQQQRELKPANILQQINCIELRKNRENNFHLGLYSGGQNELKASAHTLLKKALDIAYRVLRIKY